MVCDFKINKKNKFVPSLAQAGGCVWEKKGLTRFNKLNEFLFNTVMLM